MNKEKFCKIIRSLDRAEQLEQGIANLIEKYENEECIYYPDRYGMVISHANTVINLLEEIMEDTSYTISYFCYDIDFGRSYHDGCIVLDDGTNFDISTPEKLYDLLVFEMKNKKSTYDNPEEDDLK